MNNVFDIKRFWKYLVYDLRQTVANFGIGLLVVGALPVVIYLATGVFSLVFNHGQWNADPATTQICAAIAAVIVLIMVFPSKVYGSITDRKAGASWALIPASVPEKFVSMLLVSLVIVPGVVVLMLFCFNALMGWIVPGYEDLFTQFLRYDGTADGVPVQVNTFWLAFVYLASSILVFLLGAVTFKKSKVGKTILCLMGLSILFSFCISLLAHSGWKPDIAWFETATPETISSRINLGLNLVNTVVFLLLGGCLYARLRTIKY